MYFPEHSAGPQHWEGSGRGVPAPDPSFRKPVENSLTKFPSPEAPKETFTSQTLNPEPTERLRSRPKLSGVPLITASLMRHFLPEMGFTVSGYPKPLTYREKAGTLKSEPQGPEA